MGIYLFYREKFLDLRDLLLMHLDDGDIIISTEDFMEGEEGWKLVELNDITQANTGLKIGKDVTLETDQLPSEIVEIPLSNLKQEKSEKEDKEQRQSTPMLFQQAKKEESKEKEEGDDQVKKEISIVD